MPLLSAAAIRAARDSKTKDIVVEEWSGTVRICSLNLGQRLGVEKLSGAESLIPHLLAVSLVDEEGKLLFDEAGVKDIMAKDSAPALKLFEEIIAFNGLRKDSLKSAEKNSETTRNGSSHTDSPLPSAAPLANSSTG